MKSSHFESPLYHKLHVYTENWYCTVNLRLEKSPELEESIHSFSADFVESIFNFMHF